MKEIRQGDTFHRRICFTYPGVGPVSLTDVTAFSQIRRKPGDELIAEAETVIDVENGTIDVIFTAEKTAAIEPGTYGYDVRIKSAGNTYTVDSEKIKVVKPFTEVA